VTSDGDRRGVTRRKVLAGSALAVGASASLASGTTGAYFSDDESATDNLSVASLAKAVQDNSSTNWLGGSTAEFQLTHQVQMSGGFDRLEIVVRNASTVVQTYANRPKDGTVTFTGGTYGETYQFEFAVYATDSATNPVMVESVTDQADGNSPSNNDLPTIDSWSIQDNSQGGLIGEKTIDLEVTYQASNIAGFSGSVRVQFQSNDGPSATVTEPVQSSDTIVFPHNGQTVTGLVIYQITIEIVSPEGTVIVSDQDTEWVGTWGGSPNSNGVNRSEIPDRFRSRVNPESP